MGVRMNILNTKAAGYGAAVLVGGLVIYFVGKQILDFFKDKAPPPGSFDITSDRNLAYRGTNAIGEALTGDKDFSLGGWLYDLTHDEYDPNAPPTFEPRTTQVRKTAALYESLLSPPATYLSK